MKRRTRRLTIEACIVGIILTTLTILIIPKFLAAQNINTTKHFPDPNFRRAVEVFMGIEPDEPFTQVEASLRKGAIYCVEKQSNNITGIEYFKSLNILDIRSNQIESLDLTKNQDLIKLNFCGNKIREIDLSQNLRLEQILCIANELININLSHNKNLKKINILANEFENLDLSQNYKLEELSCGSNNITNLDLTKNPLLNRLSCGRNNISELNLTKNLLLATLSCYGNQITTLDLTNNQKLQYIGCSHNHITKILLPDKSDLLSLKCADNKLEDISELLKLKFFQYLDIRYNNLDIKQLEGAREMLKNMYKNGFTTKGVEYLPQQNIGFADTPQSWQGDFKD